MSMFIFFVRAELWLGHFENRILAVSVCMVGIVLYLTVRVWLIKKGII